MGNDLDVCSKDQALVDYFEAEHGPSKESIWQFITRSSDRFCNNLVQPKRHQYESMDLHQSRYCSPTFSFSSRVGWDATEFKVQSQGLALHCCFWRIKLTSPLPTQREVANPICIIYLHTNLRALSDALEVLPAAEQLGAHVLAMDIPGCGKSDGKLNGSIAKDIEVLIEWAKCLAGDNVQVVLWARGLSTYPAIALCASHNPRPSFWKSKADTNITPSSIKAVVLDSPFTGIQDMVGAAVERMHGKGFTLTKTILSWGIRRMLGQLQTKLDGLDLFSVKPLEQVDRIRYPACVLAADDDDYIPAQHGTKIASKWGGPVQCMGFSGKHYGQRTSEVVLAAVQFLRHYLTVDDAATPPGPLTCCSMMAMTAASSGTTASEAKEEDGLHFVDIEQAAADPAGGFDDEDDGNDLTQDLGYSRSRTFPVRMAGSISFAQLPSQGLLHGHGHGVGIGMPRAHSMGSLGGLMAVRGGMR